ncbi:Periplasmic divalent cation tolerance protein CutA [hydrothermal vent metagenome]|uniref:Periplasmic divalent cation tolerance protein CutA n=1 Tax=hydrothermal vent metagenome TaxID=652676 RepID=A0A3B1AWM4_9ZZZZ
MNSCQKKAPYPDNCPLTTAPFILYLCAMPTPVLLTLCTCPDRETAEQIANALVTRGLAACVNLAPSVTSIYEWEGKLETAEEILLLIKTSKHRYTELEQTILSLHPYELPEIIAVPVEQGLSGYLNWVEKCTTSASNS